jgi:NitT/TauT family transport system permease protein
MADNHDELLTALRSTAQDAALGLGLSIVIGVLLAVIVAQSKLLDRAIFPYLTVAQTIPIFAIAPLIDYAVGGGHTAIVLVSLIIAVFPMIANTALGLNSVDNNQVNLFRMYNANRWQELIHLRLPFSIPYMLTGIRVSSGLAIIGAIVGQVLLGNGGPDGGGLGYEIQYSAHQGDYSWLLAAAVVAALLGIVVFIVLGALSNLALRNWHESAVQHEN